MAWLAYNFARTDSGVYAACVFAAREVRLMMYVTTARARGIHFGQLEVICGLTNVLPSLWKYINNYTTSVRAVRECCVNNNTLRGLLEIFANLNSYVSRFPFLSSFLLFYSRRERNASEQIRESSRRITLGMKSRDSRLIDRDRCVSINRLLIIDSNGGESSRRDRERETPFAYFSSSIAQTMSNDAG